MHGGTGELYHGFLGRGGGGVQNRDPGLDNWTRTMIARVKVMCILITIDVVKY